MNNDISICILVDETCICKKRYFMSIALATAPNQMNKQIMNIQQRSHSALVHI